MLSPTAYQLCGFVNLSFLNLSSPLCTMEVIIVLTHWAIVKIKYIECMCLRIN